MKTTLQAIKHESNRRERICRSESWRKKPRNGRKRLKPTLSFAEVIGGFDIDHFSIEQVAQICQCNKSQIFRDLDTLKELDDRLQKRGLYLFGYDRIKGDIGCSKELAELLYEYRKLASNRGLQRATLQIYEAMRTIYDKRKRN